MRDDRPDDRPEHLVAGGVIAVVVGVDQDVDRVRRLLLEALDARLRGVDVLAVDDQHPVARREPSDRAASAREDPDPAAQILELRDRRRRRLRLVLAVDRQLLQRRGDEGE